MEHRRKADLSILARNQDKADFGVLARHAAPEPAIRNTLGAGEDAGLARLRAKDRLRGHDTAQRLEALHIGNEESEAAISSESETVRNSQTTTRSDRRQASIKPGGHSLSGPEQIITDTKTPVSKLSPVPQRLGYHNAGRITQGAGINAHPQPKRSMPDQPITQQIYIPNDMIGGIIGKGGTKINEIRQLSGSVIKIHEPLDDSNERLVTITGTTESNQMALYMLYSRLGMYL
jgi:hypothetical protein